MTTPLWEPSPDRVASTEIAKLCVDLDLEPSYAALHGFSIAEPKSFWQLVWDRYRLVGDRGDEIVRPGQSFREARFFPGARLNYAENLLAASTIDPDTHTAISFSNEEGHQESLTLSELRRRVSVMQQAMRRAGVGVGDVVAAWMPNIPDTVVVFLAANSLGAVFTSGSPDFGANGLVDRFGQAGPKLLFATDSYLYAGKVHDTRSRLAEVQQRLDSVEQTILVPYLNNEWEQSGEVVPMSEFVEGIAPTELTFERVDFDHPLFILFSSGTTGAPKAIVHRTGGVLLKLLTEQRVHCDIGPGDTVFFFTTAGWMMWNWLVTVLASEATIVLFDGSPFHPTPGVLFDLVDREGATLLGISAKFIDALNKAGARPRETHDLGTIRTICSTGSTLVHEGFEYVYQHMKADVHLASMSGGTDLCGCLVGGDPTSPVFAGEIQAPSIGLDIAVLDDDGRALGAGEQGELVCRNPFPSIPLHFVGDPDNERFDASYFQRFPNAWHQGDYAEWTSAGGMIISGRSDATLNPGGVRIGTAEIYRQVDKLAEVEESIVIGQPWDGDTRIVLFVRLTDSHELTSELETQIRDAVRTGASPRHVPAKILAVTDIPRTRSGKISELAVRDIVQGRAVVNSNALANPEALNLFRDRVELTS